MTDTDTGRRVTEEHEPILSNGKVFWCYLQKWGKVAALIVVGGAAWGAVRGCVTTGAGVMGLQTTKAAEEIAEEHEADNNESHKKLWRAVGRIEVQSQQAADNTDKIVRGMPAPWKRRAGIQ